MPSAHQQQQAIPTEGAQKREYTFQLFLSCEMTFCARIQRMLLLGVFLLFLFYQLCRIIWEMGAFILLGTQRKLKAPTAKERNPNEVSFAERFLREILRLSLVDLLVFFQSYIIRSLHLFLFNEKADM